MVVRGVIEFLGVPQRDARGATSWLLAGVGERERNRVEEERGIGGEQREGKERWGSGKRRMP